MVQSPTTWELSKSMRLCLVILLLVAVSNCGPVTCPEVECGDRVFVRLDPPAAGAYHVELITEDGDFSFHCADGTVDGEGAIACDARGFQLEGQPTRVELRVQSGLWSAEHRFTEITYHDVRAGGIECPSACVHAELDLVLQ